MRKTNDTAGVQLDTRAAVRGAVGCSVRPVRQPMCDIRQVACNIQRHLTATLGVHMYNIYIS
jgi:hypothetical protein